MPKPGRSVWSDAEYAQAESYHVSLLDRNEDGHPFIRVTFLTVGMHYEADGPFEGFMVLLGHNANDEICFLLRLNGFSIRVINTLED